MQKNKWNERLDGILSALGWNLPRLSKEIAKRKGLTASEEASLLERLYKADQVKNPRGSLIEDIAVAAGLTLQEFEYTTKMPPILSSGGDILNQVPKEDVTTGTKPSSMTPIPHDQLVGNKDLPVYAATQGGRGLIIVSENPVEYVARPEPLAKVQDGYGVIVLDDSMIPEFRSNDIALIHPHLNEKAGDTCIFLSHQADGSTLSMIKYLVRKTADKYYLREWNGPDGKPRDFTVKRSEWQECRVTVGCYKRR